VVFFHQATITFYHGMGWPGGPAFRQTPILHWGVPQLWNSAFWGGLWGVLFAILKPQRPASMPLWLFAEIFCLALPLVIGAGMFVPLSKGTPIFANGDTTAMLCSLRIYGV